MRVSIVAIALNVILCGCVDKKATKDSPESGVAPTKPNIVIIYVDDLGYGDVGAYGATQVKTPNIDNLAKGGLRFTDAHSSAATCSPSRYSLLTGNYAFRNKVKILEGDAPLLIDPNEPTLPKMLQKAGYSTGIVGKWHLGLGNGQVDWNERVSPGPKEVGFGYSFLIPATGDRVPTVYLENQQVVNLEATDPISVSYKKDFGVLPTGKTNPELMTQKADGQHSGSIVNNISRIGYMKGGEKALWVDEDFPDILTQKSKDFIKKNKDNPFFLYVSYHDIHVPRLPNDSFKGATEMGVRGDVIAQMDWCTGQVVDFLKSEGLEEQTLIIFSSDNGPVLYDGYADESVARLGNHTPSGPYSGGKYSALEAGTRVPTIAYWPNTIVPNTTNALFSQVDLYRSLAQLVGQEVAKNEAMDSQDLLDDLLGKTHKGREFLVEESFTLSLRKGPWKYIKPHKKGAPKWIESSKQIRSGGANTVQLYNLDQDPSELSNVAEQHPEQVMEMEEMLEQIELEHSGQRIKGQ